MNTFTLLRAVLLAMVLVVAAPNAGIRAGGTSQAIPTTQTKPGKAPVVDDEIPVGGILIIAGIIGGLILLAWISSRIGDSRGGSMMS